MSKKRNDAVLCAMDAFNARSKDDQRTIIQNYRAKRKSIKKVVRRQLSWGGHEYEKIWHKGKMSTVELEFVVHNDTSNSLEHDTYTLLNAMTGVQLKGDCSVNTSDSDLRRGDYQELVVSFRDDNYKRLTNVLSIMRNAGFTVNKSCGMHVHLDGRDIDTDRAWTRFHRMAGFEHELAMLVPSWRFDGGSNNGDEWCRLDSADGYSDEYDDSERYYAFNWSSWSQYQTLEVRMGAGTFREGIVKNWVKLLNYAWDNHNVRSLKDITNQPLRDWIGRRARQLGNTNPLVA